MSRVLPTAISAANERGSQNSPSQTTPSRSGHIGDAVTSDSVDGVMCEGGGEVGRSAIEDSSRLNMKSETHSQTSRGRNEIENKFPKSEGAPELVSSNEGSAVQTEGARERHGEGGGREGGGGGSDDREREESTLPPSPHPPTSTQSPSSRDHTPSQPHAEETFLIIEDSPQ